MKNEMSDTESVIAPIEPSPATTVQDTLRGRSLFALEMTASGLAVRTVFLTEQNQLVEMPAIFPDVHYALAQIDELRRMVMERFAEAAHIGAQVIAAQAAEQNQKSVEGANP